PDGLVAELRRELLLLEELGVHSHDEDLLVVRTVEDPDAAALGKELHAAPQVVVVEILRGRRLEGVHLAALRIDSGHHVLDRAILAGGVHRLKGEEDGPAVLRVEPVLELGERLDPDRQRLLRPRLVLGSQVEGVARVDVLQAERRAVLDSEGLGEAAGLLDDLLEIHSPLLRPGRPTWWSKSGRGRRALPAGGGPDPG